MLFTRSTGLHAVPTCALRAQHDALAGPPVPSCSDSEEELDRKLAQLRHQVEQVRHQVAQLRHQVAQLRHQVEQVPAGVQGKGSHVQGLVQGAACSLCSHTGCCLFGSRAARPPTRGVCV